MAEFLADEAAEARTGDHLELKLWLRLLACSTLIEKRVRSNFRREFGVTLPRFDLMAQLDRAPEGLTMGELSNRLMVSAGNITGLIDRLVGEGLVSREPSPSDRRAQHVRLTAEGKTQFDRMTPAHAEWVRQMLRDGNRKNMKQIFELLGDLKVTLEKGGGR